MKERKEEEKEEGRGLKKRKHDGHKIRRPHISPLKSYMQKQIQDINVQCKKDMLQNYYT